MTSTVAGFYREINEDREKLAEYRSDPQTYLQGSGLDQAMIDLIDRNDPHEIRAQIETDLSRDIGRIIIIWFDEA